jgi:hypothetical protein
MNKNIQANFVEKTYIYLFTTLPVNLVKIAKNFNTIIVKKKWIPG